MVLFKQRTRKRDMLNQSHVRTVPIWAKKVVHDELIMRT